MCKHSGPYQTPCRVMSDINDVHTVLKNQTLLSYAWIQNSISLEYYFNVGIFHTGQRNWKTTSLVHFHNISYKQLQTMDSFQNVCSDTT